MTGVCIVYSLFDSGDLKPVPARGPQELNYPLRVVVHNALPRRLSVFGIMKHVIGMYDGSYERT